MNNENVKYIGVIWSDDVSQEALAKALDSCFSQPIQVGLFESSLGEKHDQVQSSMSSATPGDVLTVLIWTFCGLSFIKEMPQAYKILENWLNENNPQQLIAFAVAHKDILKPISDFCMRCGRNFKMWDVGKNKKVKPNNKTVIKKADVLPSSKISANANARAKIAQNMDSLSDQMATAFRNGDMEMSGVALKKIMKLQQEGENLSATYPSMIST